VVRRFAAVLLLGLAVSFAARADVDPAEVPAELKENFEVFRVRCSKCHPLSKPYNVRLPAADWAKYVAKMKRRQGSGINDENGAKIVEFLKWKDGPRDGGAP
jgi:hypothetical protein